jgi:hypothetical protein
VNRSVEECVLDYLLAHTGANSLEGHNRLTDDWMRYEQKKWSIHIRKVTQVADFGLFMLMVLAY